MKHRTRGFLILLAAPLSAVAQQPSAWPTPPTLPPPAPLTVPAVIRAALPNGIQLRVVQQTELPLVQVTLSVTGGSRLDGDEPGMASFMAGMLDEGAANRDATALQGELAFLGASLSTTADWDRFVVSLKVPVRTLPEALALMADVVQRPDFHADDVRRQRDLRLTSLLQQRDQPSALAGLAFNEVTFPAGHPYHDAPQGDSTHVAAFDSAAVRTFYQAAMRPDRATLYVVGDISEAKARELLNQHFGAWRAVGAARPIPVSPPQASHPSATRVWLVDKPAAAQSVIIIGWPGVERTSPDYPAITVMNTILGGSFSSRLNMNLRETRGYTYGAGSGFGWRSIPGPFTASAQVRTNVTDSSLVEFFRELRAIRDTPVSTAELERAKAYVVMNIPGSLESTSQVAGEMAQLAVFGLTLDELPRLASRIENVSAEDVQTVARKYLTPDQANVVIVGDLAKIRGPIEALNLGSITVLPVSDVAR